MWSSDAKIRGENAMKYADRALERASQEAGRPSVEVFGHLDPKLACFLSSAYLVGCCNLQTTTRSICLWELVSFMSSTSSPFREHSSIRCSLVGKHTLTKFETQASRQSTEIIA